MKQEEVDIRLLSEVDYFLVNVPQTAPTSNTKLGTLGIYFVKNNKKSLINRAKSFLQSNGYSVLTSGTLTNCRDISASIVDSELYISIPSIKSGTYLYLVGQDESNIIEICNSSTISNGVISEKFDLAEMTNFGEMNNGKYKKTYIIHSGMSFYNEVWNKYIREMNILFNKKTSKLIPGHKYDLEEGTFWYLGTVGNSVSEYYNEIDYTKYENQYIFVNKLPENAKTISDVLKEIKTCRIYKKLRNVPQNFDKSEEVLLIIKETSRVTDSGEELKDDSKCILDFYCNWIDNQKKIPFSIVERTILDTTSSPTISRVWNIIMLLSSTIGPYVLEYDYNYKNTVGKKLTDFMQEAMNQVLIDYIDKDYYPRDCMISSSADDKIKQTRLKKQFFNLMSNINSKSLEKFFTRFGIDINQIVEKAVDFYKTLNFNDFDTFYKYRKSFQIGIYGKSNLEKGISPRGNEKSGIEYVKKCYSSPFIVDTICEMLELVRENFGLVSNLFNNLTIYTYGSRNNSNVSINVEIILDNLIDFCGGVDKLTDEQKKDIVREKFIKFSASFNKELCFK